MTKQTSFKKLLFLAVTSVILTVLLALSVFADGGMLNVSNAIGTEDDDAVITWGSITGEEPPHTCVYDQYVVSEDYLKEGDVYYKSCTCGEASATDTFTGGTCGGEGDGSNLTWALDTATGELVIEGIGVMEAYDSGDAPWYSYRDSIKKITVGDSVTSIGNGAFQNCMGLTSVTIPENVTTIGENAFRGTRLVEIALPAKVTSIGLHSFEMCYSLTSITVDEDNSVYHSDGNCVIETESKTLVFGCKSSVIPIDGSVTTIGDYAFAYSHLTSVTIPDSVTSIGDSAFYSCSYLTSITVDKNNAVYHSSENCLIETETKTLVRGCENSLIPTDGSVAVIGNGAFSYAAGLTTLIIPNSVTTLEPYAFRGCSFLKTVTMGDSVTTIGDYAFSYCSRLTSVTIPDSVRTIGNMGFQYCKGLTTVTIGDGVTTIGDEAFTGCTGLKTVTIGDRVTSIGDGVFYDCSSLTSVTIPDSVTVIGGAAFRNCTGLLSVTIGRNVTNIGNAAFYACTGLTTLIIPNSVTTIDPNAFRGCTGLTSVTVLSTGAKVYNSANTFSDTATIYGFAGSTAEAYATQYNRTFVPLAADITSVFELEAIYTPDAEKAGQYLPVTTFTRTDANTSSALAFLFVEGATGKLYVKSTEGVYLALYDEEGSALALGSEATDIAVVYDDNSGVSRFYVDGVIPYVGDEMVLANLLPVHDAAFHTMVAVTDTFDTLDGVSLVNVYNINASGTADFVGFQVNTNDSSSIRLLAGVDMLYYGTVGFEVELYSAGNLQGTVESQASKVYTGVIANGNAVTADSQGYRYLTALSINGIDRTAYPYDTEVYFLVKTYTAVGGVKTYGEVKKIVISYDAASMTHVYALDESYVTE